MFLFFRIFLIRELISNPLEKAFQRRIDQERLGLMHLLHLPSVAVAVATALAAVSLPASSFAATGDGSAQKASPVMNDPGAGWREAKKTHPKKEDAKEGDAKGDSKTSDVKSDAKKTGKPVQVGSYGDWGAFLAESGKDKTCYALATPKERAPAALKRDPAYVFISNRPAEKVRNEVSIIMGFAMKDGAEARADIGGSNFGLVAKGSNAWIKNPAEESRFVEELKKGSKLIVKAASLKGKVTTDSYSLSGISQALERVSEKIARKQPGRLSWSPQNDRIVHLMGA